MPEQEKAHEPKVIKVFRNRKDDHILIPTKARKNDSGFDVYLRKDIMIGPHSTVKFDTGLFMEPPPGYELVIRPRSSVSNNSIHIALGTLDYGYRGEISVNIHNLTPTKKVIEAFTPEGKQNKIAQIVPQKIEEFLMVEVESISDLDLSTERGAGGFGSSDKK